MTTVKKLFSKVHCYCFGRIILSLAMAALLAGCEGERDDPTGSEKYFDNNPYESAERPDTMSPTLQISPSSAKLDIIGQEIIFTAKGGEGKYGWYLSNEENGELNSHGANQSSYKCRKVGNNDVTVLDEAGHYATAHITPIADAMTITPGTVALSGGTLYVSFTVTGGTPPYSWTSGSASLGTISYSASTSYIASYTAVAGVSGQNNITVRDAEGRVATATITQSP